MNDERFYEDVALELENRTVFAGLYAKCYAEAAGDESKARALYIRKRVAELKADDEERRRLEARKDADRKKQEDQLRAHAERQRNDKLKTELMAKLALQRGSSVWRAIAEIALLILAATAITLLLLNL